MHSLIQLRRSYLWVNNNMPASGSTDDRHISFQQHLAANTSLPLSDDELGDRMDPASQSIQSSVAEPPKKRLREKSSERVVGEMLGLDPMENANGWVTYPTRSYGRCSRTGCQYPHDAHCYDRSYWLSIGPADLKPAEALKMWEALGLKWCRDPDRNLYIGRHALMVQICGYCQTTMWWDIMKLMPNRHDALLPRQIIALQFAE